MTENTKSAEANGEELALLKRATAIDTASQTNPIRIVASLADEDEEEEELPEDVVDTIYYITSDSWAPPYLVKTFARDRTLFSRVIWSIFGLALWALFFTYLVYSTRFLASQPTSTELSRVPQEPFVFPAVAVCLTTLNSTKATEFVTLAPEGVRGVLNGTSNGIACVAGIGSSEDDVPNDGTCGGRTIQWIDFPFSVLPVICNVFNVDGLVTTNSPGGTVTIVGRFPGFRDQDLFSFSLTSQDAINIVPILDASATKGVLTKVLFSQQTTSLIKGCNATGSQVSCKAAYHQSCVERLCNCKYPSSRPETIPGNCEDAFLNGTCPVKSPVFPCPPGHGRPGSNCTLLQACNPDAACPLPSCTSSSFPMSTSLRPVPNAVGGRDLFTLSITLASTEVELAQEVAVYTGWQYFTGILAFMAGLLGFSVVTCCEFWDNGFMLRRKRREKAARDAAKEAERAKEIDEVIRLTVGVATEV